MKKSSTSVLVFGVYLVGMGLGLVAVPNFVLGTFGLPATNEVWVRVVGVLALALAYYYISAARADLTTFAQMTVPARIGVFIAFTVFVLADLVGPVMILLGSVDLLGALWTWSALRSEK
ncbi:MAG: hypothetical protein IT312_01455 [Anaerolineales bacterium]|nr:hypothetical protein [Anaerolineales bacterium]